MPRRSAVPRIPDHLQVRLADLVEELGEHVVALHLRHPEQLRRPVRGQLPQHRRQVGLLRGERLRGTALRHGEVQVRGDRVIVGVEQVLQVPPRQPNRAHHTTPFRITPPSRTQPASPHRRRGYARPSPRGPDRRAIRRASSATSPGSLHRPRITPGGGPARRNTRAPGSMIKHPDSPPSARLRPVSLCSCRP